MEPIRRRRSDPEVEHRRRVIVALLRQHPDGLTAREIGEATGMSRNLTASALSGLFTRGVLHKRGHRYVLAAQEEALERGGAPMAEEGTLSIVRRGSGYQVRYASNHPYDPERPPHACDDEQTLIAFLHHLGLEAGAIRQACTTVQTGGVAVLRILLSPGQRQAFFRLPPPQNDTPLGAYYAVYQSGAELLGVGLTAATAVQDAERWHDRVLSSLTAYGLDGPRGETRGVYYLRPCTPELYATVQAGDRSIPYAVNEEGYLAVLDPHEA